MKNARNVIDTDFCSTYVDVDSRHAAGKYGNETQQQTAQQQLCRYTQKQL